MELSAGTSCAALSRHLSSESAGRARPVESGCESLSPPTKLQNAAPSSHLSDRRLVFGNG